MDPKSSTQSEIKQDIYSNSNREVQNTLKKGENTFFLRMPFRLILTLFKKSAEFKMLKNKS
jgi:hypothetical protein